MHTLTVSISDAVYEPLPSKAAQAGRTPEEFVEEWVANAIKVEAENPLLHLLGTLRADEDDVAARHDNYIGQALKGNPGLDG